MNEDIGLLCTDDFRAFTVIEFQTAFGNLMPELAFDSCK